ncbi:hypothetical protein AVEN_66968-1 [Araneus ventricosus]|uniref:Uncharacterized protein n=1 Tax=Araneus ventricosus TaxID=182803 RepID=A0A4Y2T173_ARAVE|nr:hypothetical protein AVEN_257177-1 [Araneus ventricosus]GBN93193.1 hypothetical protein AVEN_66968-1 [Araneus ventricosus]
MSKQETDRRRTMGIEFLSLFHFGTARASLPLTPFTISKLKLTSGKEQQEILCTPASIFKHPDFLGLSNFAPLLPHSLRMATSKEISGQRKLLSSPSVILLRQLSAVHRK